MDNSSNYRLLWLMFFLGAGMLASMTLSGCKTGMMSNVKFPKMGMENGPFKMLARGDKNKTAQPPSRHFDEGTANNSGKSDTQLVIDEPDINAVAALDSAKPSENRSPTLPENGNRMANNRADLPGSPATGKSGFGFPNDAPSLSGNVAAGNPESPIRKPYQMPDISGDKLKSAAGALANDLERMSEDSRNRFADATIGGISPQGSTPTSPSNLANLGQASSVTPGNTNQSAGQFSLPPTNPGLSSPDVNQERPKFGFSVPPANSANAPTGLSPSPKHNGNQFVSVPGSSQPVNNSATFAPLQPRPPAPAENPPASGNPGSFPSTGYGSYVTTPSGGNNATADLRNGAPTGNSEANSRWVTMPQTSNPPFAAPNADAGNAKDASGLPTALLQRSGSYSPGSTGSVSSQPASPWR